MTFITLVLSSYLDLDFLLKDFTLKTNEKTILNETSDTVHFFK